MEAIQSPSSMIKSYTAGLQDTRTCAFCAVGGLLSYLNKKGSLQCLSQVLVTAEQSKLLLDAQLASQHAAFLQLLQLLPESTHSKRYCQHTYTYNMQHKRTTNFLFVTKHISKAFCQINQHELFDRKRFKSVFHQLFSI